MRFARTPPLFTNTHKHRNSRYSGGHQRTAPTRPAPTLMEGLPQVHLVFVYNRRRRHDGHQETPYDTTEI